MKRTPALACLALLLCLSACGTAPPVSSLPAPTLTRASVSSTWHVAPVQWQVPASVAVTEAEQAQLRAHLHAALQAALDAQAVPGRAVTVQATITDIEPVSPGLNALSALLLFVPLDAGAAAVHVEAFERESGVRVAQWEGRYSPPMRQLRARFSRLAPAELALHQLAESFAHQLAADTHAATTAAR